MLLKLPDRELNPGPPRDRQSYIGNNKHNRTLNEVRYFTSHHVVLYHYGRSHQIAQQVSIFSP
uniref:AlNc14C72G4917 protein n=1 Tax=Albugo laibachii Nc14 TaxID=890382 RepID=F0WE58_9STRA|nr:AlNc14C72G4917 [Albugo laibachii Nc14]|eukprot:CCA19487.1 AlNc14C72G4917 [Albugo laibachii Nc14]